LFSQIAKEIRRLLDTIFKTGTFSHNIAISTMGSTTAYLVGFLLSPILARIYQPEAYGLFALFNALVTNFGIFITLDYINAFLLPKSKSKFTAMVQLSLSLVIISSSLAVGVLALFKWEVLQFFNAEKLGNLVFLAPIVAALTGINRILNQWNLREKEFALGAKVRVVTVVGSKMCAIVFGLLVKGNPLGFIAGEMVGRVLSTFVQIGKKIRLDLSKAFQHSITEMVQVAKEYRNYPMFNLPGNTIISLSAQLPVYLLSFQFSAAMTGYYSLAMSLTSVPTQIMGASIARVYFQKAVEIYQQRPDQLMHITIKFLRSLILLAVIPFSMIGVFGAEIFSLVFGSQWEMAGIFASVLSILAYVNFISLSICSLYQIIRKERLQFIIVLIGGILLFSLLALITLFDSALELVLAYSVISTLIQIVLLAVILIKVNIRPVVRLAEVVIAYLVGFSICYLLKDLIT
jgi:O-antigen/teichoic acid export membrane protein